jgi:hypothetical protein
MVETLLIKVVITSVPHTSIHTNVDGVRPPHVLQQCKLSYDRGTEHDVKKMKPYYLHLGKGQSGVQS